MRKYAFQFVLAFVVFGLLNQAKAGPLHDAAMAGNTSAAEALIAAGTDVNEVDWLAGAPLHIAAVNGHVDIAGKLIRAGADVNIREFSNDETPLHWAARNGSANVIVLLAENGADLDVRSASLETPLLLAAEHARGGAVRSLVSLGADITLRGRRDLPVAHLAGLSGMPKIVEFLLLSGPQPEPPDKVTPLLATADAKRGEDLFRGAGNCYLCHGGSKASRRMLLNGPELWNVVGRGIAALEDYEYSPALLSTRGLWDYENLNLLLTSAKDYFPGTEMYTTNFALGLADPQDRADIIAFLRLQSDTPVPLP